MIPSPEGILGRWPEAHGKGTIARPLTAYSVGNVVVRPFRHSPRTSAWRPLIGKPLAIISDARLGERTEQRLGRAATSHYWRGHSLSIASIESLDWTAADAFPDPDERTTTARRRERCASIAFRRSTLRPLLLW